MSNHPRIMYYYQTFNGLDKILNKESSVTHINLSSIHFGIDVDSNKYIHLNDYEPTNKIFDKVWEQLNVAKQLGIKIILMIGGAGGAFGDLFSDFNYYYSLLLNLLNEKSVITGIDLDIEESSSLDNVKMLIKKIKNDFPHFEISLAPVQYALQNDSPGMGGFIYKDLYKSDEGKLIDYFNGQFYSDFSSDSYDQVIENGYPSDKIVIGMISSQDFTNVKKELGKIFSKYKDKFGGVFIWEYFDGPDNWSEDIAELIIDICFENYQCAIN